MASPWQDPEVPTYDEWAVFVAEHPSENTILEYKDTRVLSTPSGRRKLVQDISAMANTYGGLMLVGVAGKDGSYTVEGFDRANHARDSLRDRVVNLCLDMTWPPLFIEPFEVESADSTRAILVMRLHPRLETPTFFHLEGESGCFECYVRAHGRKYAPKQTDQAMQWYTGIDLATDLPELHGRGDRAAAIRSGMLSMSRDRVSIWLQQMALEIGSKARSEQNHVEVAISPLFPREPLAARETVRGHVEQWQDGLQKSHASWFDNRHALTRFELMGGGARLVSVERPAGEGPAHWLYAEATDMGLVYCSLGLPGYYWPSRSRARDRNTMSADGLCMVAASAFNLAAALYQASGYPGSLAIEWDIGPDIKWMVIGDLSSKFCTHSTWHRQSAADFAFGARFWSAARAEIGAALEDLAWTFGASESMRAEIPKRVAQYLDRA